jgi:CubicO group peptidase (beta-lactamase class C family)
MRRLKTYRALNSTFFCAITMCSAAINSSATAQQSPVSLAIDTTMQRYFALGATPGLGVVVVRDTQVIFMKGYGYADVERRRPFTESTEFYIASTTKSFTGLAAAILAERGVWSLDDRLSRFLPNLMLQAPLSADSITIRSLLTHTHGIGNSGPVVTRLAYTGEYTGNAQLISLLREHAPARTGRAYSYGNIGYNVAAFAMDAVTHESWKETLKRLIFDPLGMKSTTAYASRVPTDRIAIPYRYDGTGFVPMRVGKTDANMQSAGGLFSTLSDMSRWLEVHINDGKLDGKQVLPANAVRESHKILATTDQRTFDARQIGYGLGWEIIVRGNDTVLVHGGGFPGYATSMSFSPSRKVGVVLMANNAELGSGVVEIAAKSIYDAVASGKAADADTLRSLLAQAEQGIRADFARRAARPQTLQFPLGAYAGRYMNPAYGTIVVSVVNGKLEATMGAAWSAVETYDASKNQLRFALFGNGEVVDVTMVNGRADSIRMSGTEFKRQ